MTERICYACGERAAAPATRCDCGEPLWLDTDPHDFDWNAVADDPGMWRYAELLPFDSPGGVADAAGGTPLLRLSRLDEFAGVRLHLKDEGSNPTGSFKDRGSALGVAAALESGVNIVGTVSHGNMAMSTAANAASAGLDCVVLVPDDIPESRIDLISQYGPRLLRVSGDYAALYDRSLELGVELEIPFYNSDVPLRVEGQKTTALEICEAFAPGVPDAIVLPVSSGGHASGVWKALRELKTAGTIDQLPRLYFAQAAACAPIAEAFDAGDDAVSPVEGGETIAYSIANRDPPSGTRALTAARETDGGVVAVDDDEIRAARGAIAESGGLSVESASATSLAAIRRLAVDGELGEEDDVVAVATGRGVSESPPSSERATVDRVDIDELGERLGSR
ncbi:threonine synthase [Haloprofundus marisrubri]|uniref:Threonine synthase n=1 Tax=Haloprofundus marisrubri TaxID=1514971 RepID=A0A0W1R3X4_9EURY|nr:threonine synthase [Haloprofundus marisrubri]KTG07883.1 threonine synthase [Haloprofundus marisrubri]